MALALDKRIKDYHGIKCFASRNNRECFGEFGYFADSITEFANLDNCAKGICHFQDDENFPFWRIDDNPEEPMEAYPIFCPISNIIEETINTESKAILKQFIQIFSDNGKLNADMCIIKHDDTDYKSVELDLYTKLSEISLTNISMDSKVCHAYYDFGCLFVELESD